MEHPPANYRLQSKKLQFNVSGVITIYGFSLIALISAPVLDFPPF